MMMDWRGLNRNKMRIWLEAGMALLLVIVIGVAGHNGAFTKKDAKADKGKSTKQETLNKAAKENEAAKSGKDAGGADESEGKKDKTETVLRIRVAKHASAASADTRRSLGLEGRAGFAPRTWAGSGHCRYLPKKRGE